MRVRRGVDVVLGVSGSAELVIRRCALRHGAPAAMRAVVGVVAGDALAMTLALARIGAVASTGV